jgi:hypothetical protein
MTFFNAIRYDAIRHLPTKTSREVMRNTLQLTRQCGRTSYLIDSIKPYVKTIIVVHSLNYARDLNGLIHKRRPYLNKDLISFVTWEGKSLADLLKPFQGIKECAVLMDNAVMDLILLHGIEKVYDTLAARGITSKTQVTKTEL